jgi:NADH-quinone oxidoreductase subunit J
LIAFWLLALALIASAVFTITAKKPVYSVLGLLGNFVALAIVYLTLQAEFLAVIQIVVYSGAILVLFLFVIALLSSGVKPFDVGPDKMPKVLVPAGIIGAVALVVIVFSVVRAPFAARPSIAAGSPGALGPTGQADVFGSVGDFGHALFTANLLPFEVTALLLMVAVIGVVLLAGDDEPARHRPKSRAGEREPIVKPQEPLTR